MGRAGSRAGHSGCQHRLRALFTVLSGSHPVTRWLSIATVTTASSLREDGEDATGSSYPDLEVRCKKSETHGGEAECTDTIKPGATEGMAEGRRRAAQTGLERGRSGLRTKEKRHFRASAMHVRDIDS